MKRERIGGLALLLLCAFGCASGPPATEVLEHVRAQAETADVERQKLDLPRTTYLAWDKSFLDALAAAGYVEIGACQEGTTNRNQQWVRCDVELTEAGNRDLEEHRIGPRRFNFVLSRPSYAVIGTRVGDETAEVDYSRTAVPTPLLESLREHGYRRPLTCGYGVAVFSRQDEAWKFEKLQARRQVPCR